MGSLDAREAKAQFLLLIDKVNGTHLPGFAIWLDSKLAEYKVEGVIKADDEITRKKQYPEWIARSLRQHFSFMVDGDESLLGPSFASQSQTSVVKRKPCVLSESSCSPTIRRISETCSGLSIARQVGSSETEEVEECVVKLEASSDSNDREQNTSRTLVTSKVMESRMPSTEQSFSLNPAEESRFPLDLPTNVFSPGKQCSAASSQLVTVESITVSTPPILRPYPISAPTTIAQRSVFTESPMPVAISSGASSHGPLQWVEGVQVRLDPESTSGQADIPYGKNPEAANDRIAKLCLWTKDYNGRFRCRSCLWTCRNKGDMTRHVRKHTGERPFPCSQCDYRGKYKGCLKTHMLTHTGEKPFKCVYCNKAFASSGTLLRHQRSLHADKPLTGRRR